MHGRPDNEVSRQSLDLLHALAPFRTGAEAGRSATVHTYESAGRDSNLFPQPHWPEEADSQNPARWNDLVQSGVPLESKSRRLKAVRPVHTHEPAHSGQTHNGVADPVHTYESNRESKPYSKTGAPVHTYEPARSSHTLAGLTEEVHTYEPVRGHNAHNWIGDPVHTCEPNGVTGPRSKTDDPVHTYELAKSRPPVPGVSQQGEPILLHGQERPRRRRSQAIDTLRTPLLSGVRRLWPVALWRSI